MNLIFRKSEEGQVEVLFRKGVAEDPFSYIELIKYLLVPNKLGDTEFDEAISPKEQECINNMLEKINKVVDANLEDTEIEDIL